MSVWATIVEKAFTGNQAILNGNPNCLIYSATPNAVLTAPVGTLCYDTGGDDVYINTDGSTTWIVINA